MVQAGRDLKQYKLDNQIKIAEYNEQNKERDSQTHKQYYESHKEQTQAQGKHYREENRDKITERRSIVFECPCGGRCCHNDKARHFRTLLHKNYEATLSV